MVDEKEAAMLRAFTALEGVNAAGKVELKQIKARSQAVKPKPKPNPKLTCTPACIMHGWQLLR